LFPTEKVVYLFGRSRLKICEPGGAGAWGKYWQKSRQTGTTCTRWKHTLILKNVGKAPRGVIKREHKSEHVNERDWVQLEKLEWEGSGFASEEGSAGLLPHSTIRKTVGSITREGTLGACSDGQRRDHWCCQET